MSRDDRLIPVGDRCYEASPEVAEHAQFKKRLTLMQDLVVFMEDHQCSDADLQRALQSIRVLQGKSEKEKVTR